MGQRLRYKEQKSQIGKIESFAHEDSDPTRYLFCDGSLLLIADYPLLYAKIGTNWGGDGVTDFRLPDMRGRVPRGKDGGAGVDPDSVLRGALYSGGNTGDNVGSYQDDQLKSHTHEANKGSDTGGSSRIVPTNNTNGGTGPVGIQNAGGNETRMKNASVGFYIRYAV